MGSKQTCPLCGGTKVCKVCNGSGRSSMGMPCNLCHGGKKCPRCDGKGKVDF